MGKQSSAVKTVSYFITFVCGEKEQRSITGNSKFRKEQIESIQKGICSLCFRENVNQQQGIKT